MLITGVVEEEEGEGSMLAFDASFTTYDPTLLPRKSQGATGVLTLTAYAWAGGVLGSMSLPALPLPPPHTHLMPLSTRDIHWEAPRSHSSPCSL